MFEGLTLCELTFERHNRTQSDLRYIEALDVGSTLTRAETDELIRHLEEVYQIDKLIELKRAEEPLGIFNRLFPGWRYRGDKI